MSTGNVRGFNVSYSNPKEFEHIKREIFNEGIYDIELKTESAVIIDAGAHIGVATLFFKSKYPDCEIIAVEPNTKVFALLVRNIEGNNLNKVTAINKALDLKEGKQTLYIDPTDDQWDSTGSFLKGGWAGSYNTKAIEVQTITLSSLIKDRKIDLLKLDIEGTEQRVLTEAADYLRNVKNIVIEFHPTQNQNLQKILRILRRSEFSTEITDHEKLKIITAKAQ